MSGDQRLLWLRKNLRPAKRTLEKVENNTYTVWLSCLLEYLSH